MSSGNKLKNRNEGDFLIVVLSLALSLFGLIMIFSASYYQAISKYGDPYYFLKDDLVWKILGWILFVAAANIDYRYWKILAVPALAAGVILLALIKVPGLGVTLNNATRWLNIFGLFTIMPGEVIKPCIILFFAWFLSEDPDRIKDLRMGIAPCMGILGVCFGLIMMQPNLSTAGIVLMLGIGMMFVAGLRWIYLLGAIVLGVVGFVLIVLSPKGAYMLTRVKTILDPFLVAQTSGYQVVQGLLALGSGGVFGVGIGRSVQKSLYLPEPQNDYILAIIGEELGYVGVLVLMLVYAALIWRCFKTALGCRDLYGTLLASGITIHMALQVVLNIAVVSATFFPTGVTLPLVSQGGNATILMLFELGVVLNISKHNTDGGQDRD